VTQLGAPQDADEPVNAITFTPTVGPSVKELSLNDWQRKQILLRERL
jgi:hypothetical protein